MRFGDAEIGEEERDGFRGHRGASVGVDRQLTGVDVLLGDGVGQEPLGEFLGLPRGHHPADGVAGVDVDDGVQVVVRPLRRAVEFGDVPAPALVRPMGHQFRLDLGWVDGVAATLPHLPVLVAQDPVHRGF